MEIIIFLIVLAVVIALLVNVAKKSAIKETERKKYIEDTLNSHSEFGNYKTYSISAGTMLVLAENGYYGYFLNGGDFVFDRIENAKSIKFVTEPFDRKTQKIVKMLGQIFYQLEIADFSNPIINLPFGVYRDMADRAIQKNKFLEAKATFDQLKKNKVFINVLSQTDPQESNTKIDLTALEKVCKDAGDSSDDDSIDFLLLSETDLNKLLDDKITPAFLNRHPPVKISYTDKEGGQTIRDIIPIRIDGSPKYGIGISAYCMLRKGERSFWINKISAAWFQGQESNLGDYLAALCKKTNEYKEAVRAKKDDLKNSTSLADETIKE